MKVLSFVLKSDFVSSQNRFCFSRAQMCGAQPTSSSLEKSVCITLQGMECLNFQLVCGDAKMERVRALDGCAIVFESNPRQNEFSSEQQMSHYCSYK